MAKRNAFKLNREEKELATKIVAGRIFDTPYETGCVAINSPDESGDFAALDSEGVEVSCNVRGGFIVRIGEIDRAKLENA